VYTIASVPDSTHMTLSTSAGTQAHARYSFPPPNTNPRQSMYYLSLNGNPGTDTWTMMNPVGNLANGSYSMALDTDDDVIFLFAGTDSAVYCVTTDNPVPGNPTSAQAAAGCTHGDQWNPTPSADGIYPVAWQFNGLVYDTVTKKVLLFGGNDNSGAAYNQTWAYDVPARTWQQKCAGACTNPPPIDLTHTATNQPPLAYSTQDHKVYYYQPNNTDGPAVWSYDPAGDNWKKLTSVNTPGANPNPLLFGNSYLAFDSSKNLLILWAIDAFSGIGYVWEGQLQ
jgi:hypothetical protein